MILLLERQRQEECAFEISLVYSEFEDSLGYIGRSCILEREREPRCPNFVYSASNCTPLMESRKTRKFPEILMEEKQNEAWGKGVPAIPSSCELHAILMAYVHTTCIVPSCHSSPSTLSPAFGHHLNLQQQGTSYS